MWPRRVSWESLRFGVEFEFVDGRPADLATPPGWRLQPGELQVGDGGAPSGGEMVSPALIWSERGQLRAALDALRRIGARSTWSCGLHVHVGLEPWGGDVVAPLVDAALVCQEGLRQLLRTADHRARFCPPVTPAMRDSHARQPGEAALLRPGWPQSRRCGLNLAAWYARGTVEVRYPNASMRSGEVLRAVELCLRLVAAVGRGEVPPAEAQALAVALGAPRTGYPPPQPAPLWYRERRWLEEALLPALGPPALAGGGGDVLEIRPVSGGALAVVVEDPDGTARPPQTFRWSDGRWAPVDEP